MSTLPATIRQGSSGAAVEKWQAIIGAKADGLFGPKTHIATQEWQRQHKLVPDGVVGPQTWSLALGASQPAAPGKPAEAPKPAPTPASGSDLFALSVAQKAGGNLTEAEKQYALTVARGEGFYGMGWKGAGKGSNNWGAVQGTGSAGFFEHIDHHADGKAYTGKFKRYKTPEEGFADMARILFNGGKRGPVGAAEIKGALKRGSLKDAVFAQHKNGYFELDPNKYLQAVLRNYGTLSANLRWPELLSVDGKTGGGSFPIILGAGVGLLGFGAYMLWKLRS